MKKVTFILILFLSLNAVVIPQIVTGKLLDENSNPLAQVQLSLFTPGHLYSAQSSSDGSFSFNITTNVDNNNLPSDYSVSEFYPNPFNPKTRIAITLPNSEVVKAEVFNTIGQKVKHLTEQVFPAGTNYLDLELRGLPNGVYISRITIGEKYTVVKKMMLIYGSQHLASNSPTITPEMTKSSNSELSTNLDSLVATGGLVWKMTFVNLPVFTGGTLNLGNLVVERYCIGTPTVTYEGKTYNTVQISNQCWLRENLDVGLYAASTGTSSNHSDVTNNGIMEKYCYENNESNCATYGGLYDWNEAMGYSTTPGSQGICPPGWHIPILAEFEALKATVNNDGNELKSVGQGSGGGAGTNTSGFSALLVGARDLNGHFGYLGNYTLFWSSTEYHLYGTDYLSLYDAGSSINLGNSYKESGFSVRCLKDN
ncbi:MAG: FISUMP domain-containing protein [Ignavibacteriaceae bacterium]